MLGSALLAWALAAAGALPAPALAPGECVVIQALDGGSERVFGGKECERRTLPASTFKVPHALIALDTGVLTPDTRLAWDGRPQPFRSWEQDHTLETALRASVVWFFQRTATSIGRERELAHLRAFGYGSQTFRGPVDRFWLTGDLEISPREQVAFLRRMLAYELPVDRRHVDFVKAALRMPEGKLLNAGGEYPFALAWPAGTQVWLKTGNGGGAGERVSWLVGGLDSGSHTWVLASRVRAPVRALASIAGAELALRVLNSIAP